jgi:hypothetical protein
MEWQLKADFGPGRQEEVERLNNGISDFWITTGHRKEEASLRWRKDSLESY